MKISKIKIENFRGYQQETTVDIGELTAFIGKNDVGKSTILEALDIFFDGKGIIKIDKEDINKKGLSDGNTEIIISVVFDGLPTEIIIDSTNETKLADEYLLNNDKKLEIVKKYPNAGSEKVFIKANHPTNSVCSELLLKKQKALQDIIKGKDISCADRTKNAVMRKAIWDHHEDSLQLKEIEIDATKEDAKHIWVNLKDYMPLYSLFQSDRKNSDGDSEIQDPMKLAVQEILQSNNIQNELKTISEKVITQLNLVAKRTLGKLKEMDPKIAESLNPVIPSYEKLKWNDVFRNVSISGDEGIPINKRGSGVKRLVLLSFFRAEAEKKINEQNVPNIIYAMEEPETSQHPAYQKLLITAFIELSKQSSVQIIVTTHSPAIVKMLDFENLKLITETDSREIIDIEKNNLPYPSLNEVNYLAFEEANEEYHNELYGFIESEVLLGLFKQGKPTRPYKRIDNKNKKITEDKILSEYIRHQIHHPENKMNERFTHDELQQSIDEMRNFINKSKS